MFFIRRSMFLSSMLLDYKQTSYSPVIRQLQRLSYSKECCIVETLPTAITLWM